MNASPPRPQAAPVKRKRISRGWWLKQLHTWHWISAAVSLIGMFLRILIPSGWMPAADRIGLMPCFGEGQVHAARASDHHGAHNATPHREDHRQTDKSDKPCAFTGFACALAEPADPSSAATIALAAPALFTVASAAARIGAGLAAPPPPPTGPPATA